MTTLEQLQAENIKLKSENERLRYDHLGMLTRQAGELEHERTKYTGARYLIAFDINYLKQMNDKLGQAAVDVLMKKSFDIRDEDILFKFSVKSGDEKAIVTLGNPDGIIEHLIRSLEENGLSAVMAWEPLLPTDNLFVVCERAMEKVYELKAQRGIASR